MKPGDECPLKLPADKEVIETVTSRFWFEDGILYSLSRGHKPTLNDVKETIAVLKKLVGTKKVCFIADTSKTKYYTIEMRNLLTQVLPELFVAVALVPCKPIGKIMGAILFMRRKHFRVRIFDNLEEAKEWIGQYQLPASNAENI